MHAPGIRKACTPGRNGYMKCVYKLAAVREVLVWTKIPHFLNVPGIICSEVLCCDSEWELESRLRAINSIVNQNFGM